MSARAEKAVAELLVAAREIRRVREAQAAYVRKLQKLAAEARMTGKSQSHRIGAPVVHDYGNGVEMLLEALAKYERATPPLRELPNDHDLVRSLTSVRAGARGGYYDVTGRWLSSATGEDTDATT